MRHQIAGNTLSRKPAHRKATVRDLAKATLIQERVCTTQAKAKEARKLIDRLITLGKKGTLAHKRKAFSILCDHGLVRDLFDKTSPRFKSRLGGYTRIIPLNNRRGDNAKMVYLELTEKSPIVIAEPKLKAVRKENPQESKNSAVEDAQIVKPQDQMKESSKKEKKSKIQQSSVTPEQLQKKDIMGGIKKIFNRKTGGGN